MMTDKEFLAFLNDESLEMKLNNILDEELEKSEDEMDTDLIDFCIDTILEIEAKKQSADRNEKESDEKSKKQPRHFKRILMIAAVLSVFIIGIFSASALFSEVKLFDGIAEVYNEYIRIRFDKSVKTANSYNLMGSDLAKELEKNGIAPVLLPEALLTDDYSLSDVTYERLDVLLTAHFPFYNVESKIKGSVYIEQYNDPENLIPKDYLGVEDIEKISISGVDIYVFDQGKSNCAIGYQDNNTQYTITLNADFDTALSIARTIK